MAPHLWVSTSKPPAPAFIPLAPAQHHHHHHHHRRNDSLGLALEDSLLPNRQPQPDSPDGSDRFGLACGLPIGSGKSRHVDSVSVSRPPASATSTPFSFGITSRAKSKKKITASIVANDDPYVVHIERDPSTTNALGKNHHHHHHDAVAWLSSNSDRNPEGDVIVGTTTRRIMRSSLDDDGDFWEHE